MAYIVFNHLTRRSLKVATWHEVADIITSISQSLTEEHIASPTYGCIVSTSRMTIVETMAVIS